MNPVRIRHGQQKKNPVRRRARPRELSRCEAGKRRTRRPAVRTRKKKLRLWDRLRPASNVLRNDRLKQAEDEAAKSWRKGKNCVASLESSIGSSWSLDLITHNSKTAVKDTKGRRVEKPHLCSDLPKHNDPLAQKSFFQSLRNPWKNSAARLEQFALRRSSGYHFWSLSYFAVFGRLWLSRIPRSLFQVRTCLAI